MDSEQQKLVDFFSRRKTKKISNDKNTTKKSEKSDCKMSKSLDKEDLYPYEISSRGTILLFRTEVLQKSEEKSDEKLFVDRLELAINCDVFGLHFDVLLLIMKYLTLTEVIQLAQTCRSMYYFITSDYVMADFSKRIKVLQSCENNMYPFLKNNNEITLREIANKYEENDSSNDKFSIYPLIKKAITKVRTERFQVLREERERERVERREELMNFRDEYGYWLS